MIIPKLQTAYQPLMKLTDYQPTAYFADDKADYEGFKYAWETVPRVSLGQVGKRAKQYGTNAYNIVDDFRRRYTLNKKIGTFNPYKEGNEWKWDANGELFGKQIGEGSEQYVYENLSNPNTVLKIDGNGYKDLSSMKQAIKTYQKRNRIPYQERAKYSGYMEGKDAATRTKTVYYPVYTQNKLRLETNTTPAYWDYVLAPKINEMMNSQGYKGSATTSFTNGRYTVSDMSPYNIGYDQNGNLKFFDFYVE